VQVWILKSTTEVTKKNKNPRTPKKIKKSQKKIKKSTKLPKKIKKSTKKIKNPRTPTSVFISVLFGMLAE